MAGVKEFKIVQGLLKYSKTPAIEVGKIWIKEKLDYSSAVSLLDATIFLLASLNAIHLP